MTTPQNDAAFVEAMAKRGPHPWAHHEDGCMLLMEERDRLVALARQNVTEVFNERDGALALAADRLQEILVLRQCLADAEARVRALEEVLETLPDSPMIRLVAALIDEESPTTAEALRLCDEKRAALARRTP